MDLEDRLRKLYKKTDKVLSSIGKGTLDCVPDLDKCTNAKISAEIEKIQQYKHSLKSDKLSSRSYTRMDRLADLRYSIGPAVMAGIGIYDGFTMGLGHFTQTLMGGSLVFYDQTADKEVPAHPLILSLSNALVALASSNIIHGSDMFQSIVPVYTATALIALIDYAEQKYKLSEFRSEQLRKLGDECILELSNTQEALREIRSLPKRDRVNALRNYSGSLVTDIIELGKTYVPDLSPSRRGLDRRRFRRLMRRKGSKTPKPQPIVTPKPQNKVPSSKRLPAAKKKKGKRSKRATKVVSLDDRLVTGLEERYSLNHNLAERLVTDYGSEVIREGMNRLKKTAKVVVARKLVGMYPEILSENDLYFTVLGRVLRILADTESSPLETTAAGIVKAKTSKGSFKFLKKYANRISSLEGLVDLETELDPNLESEAEKKLAILNTELDEEGYNPRLVYALVAHGLKLFSSDARIGERYIDVDNYFTNVRNKGRVQSSLHAEAKKLYQVLVNECVITTKKREDVCRLQPHVDDIKNTLLRNYVKTLLEIRREMGI